MTTSTPSFNSSQSTNKSSQKARRLHPLLTVGIIVLVIVLLAGLGILLVSQIQDNQKVQQAQTVMHAKPATNIASMDISNEMFQNMNIQVKVGTTVTWTNKDSVPHSVTFKNGMKDSGLISQGQSFRYTFTTPGTFAYYCSVHPSMLAQVVVTP